MAEKYEVKVENGMVRLFKQNGNFERYLCGDAESAEVKGDEVHVTMKNKKVRIYSVKGFFKKTL